MDKHPDIDIGFWEAYKAKIDKKIEQVYRLVRKRKAEDAIEPNAKRHRYDGGGGAPSKTPTTTGTPNV